MKKLVEISSCEECPWVDRWECDTDNHVITGYEPYCCLLDPKRKRIITTPLNTIPDWCELPDVDKYRQAIENWLGYMADWHKHLISVGSSDWQIPVRIAIRGMHCELERLSLPNNWKPTHEFGIDDFKLPEAK